MTSYFGGKAPVAKEVWRRFGLVDAYAEPFAGSLAVLLQRPVDHLLREGLIETVNDVNHYLVNFWRAVAANPERVAYWADWAVSEADLHARYRWLVYSEAAKEWKKRVAEDPHYYSAKFAGWWVWGQAQWIGGGWCQEKKDGTEDHAKPIPKLSGPSGVASESVHRKMPRLSDSGAGVCKVTAQIPKLGPANGVCAKTEKSIQTWMTQLRDRLRRVRVCYGNWDRICDSHSTLTMHGTVGVFLDPPYPMTQDDGKKTHAGVYATDDARELLKIRDEVMAWCLRWGPNPRMRIAVCGYEGDGYSALLNSGWSEFEWKAKGGYSNQNTDPDKVNNAHRERIWYSPHCRPADPDIFSLVTGK